MSILYLLISRVFSLFLVCSVFLSCFPGLVLPAIVTLESLEIYNTHQWLPNTKPVVYIQCKGENKTVLPDVKEDHVFYNFKGEESWQPLTELPSKRCKRCGFYEENSFVSDDVYEEWEFCPSDFTEPDGKYIRFKEKEFNATFLCPKCVPSANGRASLDAMAGACRFPSTLMSGTDLKNFQFCI
ncbi:uncharacterized protein LOC121266940 isoform X4 [Juglans microcarpa x Juglans regia]|uniref:uncharacterized protein LOC121266940 isoform X4 n=1 Tax=Juglans microcarpa x Juglans regia TaxID=2249226 RepID=UPI001B7E1985|nr:uncharacterized protein LOC121266940 isoform X4 [Juglans microcarpa x Juglans regia]